MRPLNCNDASEYVLEHSAIARQSRTRTIQLTRRAVTLLRRIDAQGEANSREDLERYLRNNLADPATCNPWVWLMLKILLPIIIRLVLDWWFDE